MAYCDKLGAMKFKKSVFLVRANIHQSQQKIMFMMKKKRAAEAIKWINKPFENKAMRARTSHTMRNLESVVEWCNHWWHAFCLFSGKFHSVLLRFTRSANKRGYITKNWSLPNIPHHSHSEKSAKTVKMCRFTESYSCKRLIWTLLHEHWTWATWVCIVYTEIVSSCWILLLLFL